ncbi:MAG: prephenate dehydratase domain-containing protein [Rubricoccaceae bacterium]
MSPTEANGAGTRPPGPGPVAFQGEAGAYSEAAARLLCGAAVQTVGCVTFAEAVGAVVAGRAAAAVIPVENVRVGRVEGAEEALAAGEAAGLRRLGGGAFRIAHALLGLPGAPLAGVRRVQSHPQALAQCRATLARLVPAAAPVPFYDTAGAARDVALRADPALAAIAHASAAARYGLAVLADGLEDDPENTTRFVLIG